MPNQLCVSADIRFHWCHCKTLFDSLNRHKYHLRPYVYAYNAAYITSQLFTLAPPSDHELEALPEIYQKLSSMSN